ncbi:MULTISPECIES: hypothetical protein [unclassified Blastococcus]|uniref:hypothetical protein n=1 Tax=unclassified Blastococcus TaxID=2619396 RepID=UPI0028160FA5|nr:MULTISPECIES: hypothetical protein [unclassified Blastococcus]
MTIRPARLPRALAASALALALPLTGCAGTDEGTASDTTTSPTSSSATAAGDPEPTAEPAQEPGQRLEVTVAGGQLSGDTGRVPVPVGEQVTLVITSDVADEAHVHGYDLTADLQPGTPAQLTFDATIPGVFEVELHDAGTVLLTLQVS